MIEIEQYQIDEIDSAFRDFNRDTLIPSIIMNLNELKDYWPLTLRQLYYRLVAGLVIENNQNRYKALSRIVTKLRRMEILPWEVIEDRTRYISDKRGWESTVEYSRHILNCFDQYDRCLVQNQQYHVEVFIEKDALRAIFEEVTWPFCVRVVTVRGQSSATYINNYAERAYAAINNGLHPVILYYGDLDPTGARIPVAIERSLKKYHNLSIDLIVVALTSKQVEDYALPHSIDALKETDPNCKWFKRNFGDTAVELDAIHPDDLKKLITRALIAVLDTEDMIQQVEIQKKEREKLKGVKKQVMEIMKINGLL